MNTTLTIHTDGGARGNPGPAAIGVVIEQNGNIISEFGEKIGETTNNVAEYTAVFKALQYIQSTMNRVEEIHFILDSLLVVNQLKGIFKIKDQKLQILAAKIQALQKNVCGKVIYTSVPREQNKRADYLVNFALDTKE